MLWTETSLLNPLPTWQLFSKLTVNQTIRGNQKFASLLNTWHRIIATSLCPLRPTLNFLVLISCSHAAGFWTTTCTDPTKGLLHLQDLLTIPFFAPILMAPPLLATPSSFFRHSFNKHILSTLLKNRDTTVKVVSGVSAFLELKKKRKVNRQMNMWKGLWWGRNRWHRDRKPF